MTVNLLNVIMKDGSRHFGDIPQNVGWQEMRDYLANLPGARITGFLSDYVTEAWIDFAYQGYQFSVNDQFGDYWFFVTNKACPDAVLEVVLSHSQLLLGKPQGS